MNKSTNIWLFITSIIALPLAFILGINRIYGAFDLDIFVADFHYTTLVFVLSAGVFFLIGALRSFKRWSGMHIVNQKERFSYNTIISKTRRNRVLLYNSIEVVYYLVLAIAFYVCSKEAIIISLVFLLFILDTVLNTFLGIVQKKYRVGITSKALFSTDREVIPIYFKGLKVVSCNSHQIFFEYVNDLVLDFSFENIEPEDKKPFIQALREKANDKKVYFSGFGKF